MVFKSAYLWNLPKAISLQSFNAIDCLVQGLQRVYKKNTMMTSFHIFWDSKFPYFVKLIIRYQPAKVQIPQLSESKGWPLKKIPTKIAVISSVLEL